MSGIKDCGQPPANPKYRLPDPAMCQHADQFYHVGAVQNAIWLLNSYDPWDFLEFKTALV